MSGFGLLAIQQALYARLNNDATLSGMVIGVFDRVPDKTLFPYVTIGEGEGRDWSSATADGLESELSIRVYSRGGGRKQPLEILARIHALLHEGSFSITGHSLIQSRCERAEVRLLPDGHSYEGILRLRLFTMEVL